jgi:hypothetical protein
LLGLKQATATFDEPISYMFRLIQVRRGTIVLVAGKTKWKGRTFSVNAQDELWTPPEEGMMEFEVQVIANDAYSKQVCIFIVEIHAIVTLITWPIIAAICSSIAH